MKLGGIAAKIAGVPRIVYRRGLAVPIKNRWTNRFLFKHVLTHIIANSEETKRTILANLSHIVDANDIKVIYNGIDIQKYGSSVEPLFPRTKQLIVGNAGRLSEEKGQSHLIAIAEILRSKNLDFKIVIAGNGNLTNNLKAQIQEKDLEDYVQLLGYVDEMDRFMHAIDIFVLTSHWEGFGYVMVEAMLQKKPVIAYNTSSMPEVVLDGKTGLLVDYPDTSVFAEKIEQLYHEEELRKQYGQAGYQSALDRFELNKQIKKFEQFILS